MPLLTKAAAIMMVLTTFKQLHLDTLSESAGRRPNDRSGREMHG